jgi:hypothetical protein
MIKHNKFSSNNIIELEIEREKTRQLELIRDIKKMELRLLTNEKYKKKTKNKYDVFKMFDSLNSNSSTEDSSTDTDTDTEQNDLEINMKTHNKTKTKKNRLDETDSECSDSNIDTISMCSSYSIEKYEEIELIKHN